MSTSEELREALTRRLKKIDITGGAEIRLTNNSSPEKDKEHSPEKRDEAQIFRSGWNNTPPIARSNMLPPAPLVPPSPTRSIIKKASAEEITEGLVGQRKQDIIRSGSASPDISSSMRGDSRQASVIVPAVLISSSACSEIRAPEPTILEGYLSKFSSGTLTSRWQKRYFVLRDSELEYFGKQSALRSLTATSVRFPIRKIKSVQLKGDKEFDLIIGSSKNTRKYQLKGLSLQQTKTWVTALEAMISKYATQDHVGAAASVDSIASSSGNADGGADTIGDDSSHGVSVREVTTGNVDIMWEQPEIGTEEIEALFSDWFVFLDDPRAEIKAGRMIDASSRAVSDLWSVLGSLPRGEDVLFDEAKDAVKRKILTSGGNRPSITIGEYVLRICQRFFLWLSRGGQRRAITDDIPVLIEWVSRFEIQLCDIFPPHASEDSAETDLSDDSTFSPTHSEGGSILSSPHKWRRAMKFLKQKLSSEWEILLIESVQISMPLESVWDLALTATPGPTGLAHGPCKISNFPTKFIPQQIKPILVSSWIRDFLLVIQEKCLSKSTRGTSWSVAYPTCVDLLTHHCANAAIACMNACWRELKNHMHGISVYKKSGKIGTAISKMKRITGRLSVTSPPPPLAGEHGRSGSVGSVPSSPLPSPGGSRLNMSLENLISFGNESTVISIFCQHLSGDQAKLPLVSPVFSACMESLSAAFANVANDVARSIVKHHFTKRYLKVFMGAFDPKVLAVRVKVPIADSLDTANSFLNEEIGKVGCHDLLKYVIIGQLMQAVASNYVQSMVKHKPKVAKFSRLAAVVAEDEGLFFSMFRDLGRPPTEINTAIDQISHIRAILSERDDDPPSRGGISLVHHCVEITKVFSSLPRAVEVIKALLDMKGLSKSDRKDILYSVSVCIQRNIESPSPPALDLSIEYGDEGVNPDDSRDSSDDH